MSTIDVLNSDCLSQVFLNLPFTERVKLENVCKQWYWVLQVGSYDRDFTTFSKNQCCFADMIALNIADFLCSSSTEYYQQVRYQLPEN